MDIVLQLATFPGSVGKKRGRRYLTLGGRSSCSSARVYMSVWSVCWCVRVQQICVLTVLCLFMCCNICQGQFLANKTPTVVIVEIVVQVS